jgi:hypothetical protein
MKRSTLWAWIGAAVIGAGFAGTASADPWDRDAQGGASRMQELRQSMASRDTIARPSMEKAITGHPIGRDTIERDSWKREFKDRNDMLSHMKEQTKQRASRTPAARGDDLESSTDRQYPNAGHSTVSNPAEELAKQARGNRHAPMSTEPRPMTDHEEQILGKSITGKKLGQDTITMGSQYHDFKDRNDMLAHLNTRTSMRASRTLAAQGGEEADGSHAYPNAGREHTDPSKLTDKARKGLAALGFVAAAKRQASADIEDKAR